MTTLPLIKLDCYLIDCSSIMTFSGVDFANPDRFKAYREQIWVYLENMISEDRLKTVPQVMPELEFNDTESYKRLYRLRGKFILSPDEQTDFRVLNLISKYPKLIDKNQPYTREPADPYLIVYAQKLGIPIINDEKPLAQRIGARKHKRLMIPDVCELEGMKDQSICLEKFLKDNGVIPITAS